MYAGGDGSSQNGSSNELQLITGDDSVNRQRCREQVNTYVRSKCAILSTVCVANDVWRAAA